MFRGGILCVSNNRYPRSGRLTEFYRVRINHNEGAGLGSVEPIVCCQLFIPWQRLFLGRPRCFGRILGCCGVAGRGAQVAG